MCNFYVAREKRNCKKPGFPYCAYHSKPKNQARSENTKTKILKKVETTTEKVGVCMICMDEKKLFPSKCCSFDMCKSCVFKFSRDSCPMCRNQVSKYMSENSKEIFDIVKEKQKMIDDLERDIQVLRSNSNTIDGNALLRMFTILQNPIRRT